MQYKLNDPVIYERTCRNYILQICSFSHFHMTLWKRKRAFIFENHIRCNIGLETKTTTAATASDMVLRKKIKPELVSILITNIVE